MNKILVEVYIPATAQSYDVWIPLESKISEIIFLLKRVLGDLTNGGFIATENAVLCDKETGAIFNINISAEKIGLKNGSKLMFI